MIKNILIFIFLLSCEKNSKSSYSEGEMYAPVLVPENISSPSDKVYFLLGNRRIDNIEGLNLSLSLPALNGKYLEMVQGGVLQIKESFGTLVSSNKFEKGKKPNLRYRKEGNLIIPRDYSTQAMISSYFQFSTVLANLAKISGINADEFLQKSGKIKILFEPQITLDSKNSEVSLVPKLNAAYVTGQKQFILYQRSASEDAPLAQNLQVIGHEFGHAVFEQIFYQNNVGSCESGEAIADQVSSKRLLSEYAMSGFNEGFADILSFTLVGSTNLLASSINISELAEKRNFSTVSYKFTNLYSAESLLDGSQGAPESCSSSFYCIGTLFAKSVFQAMQANGIDISSKDSRGSYTTELVNSLKTALSTMKLNHESGKMSLPSVYSCPVREPSIENDSKLTNAFLLSIVEGMPAARRTALCQALSENFELEGFNTEARKACN
jgi:hypothetical protein